MEISHKSHNASDKYPTMHHFVTEMCTHVCTFLLQNDALWDMALVHCGIWNWCIVNMVYWSFIHGSSWLGLIKVKTDMYIYVCVITILFIRIHIVSTACTPHARTHHICMETILLPSSSTQKNSVCPLQLTLILSLFSWKWTVQCHYLKPQDEWYGAAKCFEWKKMHINCLAKGCGNPSAFLRWCFILLTSMKWLYVTQSKMTSEIQCTFWRRNCVIYLQTCAHTPTSLKNIWLNFFLLNCFIDGA